MAQITVYAHAAGNWDVDDAWNDAANGSGTHYTNPQNGGGNTYICDLNGLVMNLNRAVTVDLVRATTGTLTVVGTVTLTSPITYNGTSTSGMVIVGTSAILTVTGAVTATAAGHALVTSSTGTFYVTGAVQGGTTGTGIKHIGTSATCTIAGNVTGGSGAASYGLWVWKSVV